MNVVVVSGVSKAFGSVTALRDISFEIGAGEVLGLLGPNGAGKTTMVDILSTLARPDRGHAHIAGHDVVADPAGVRRSIMLTGQHVAVDNLLTGRQNLVMFGRLQGLGKAAARARATELIREFDLTDAADRRVDTYSGGMRRRIDIACGLVVIPRVAFLDEPTTGLDPRSRHSVWELIRRLQERRHSHAVDHPIPRRGRRARRPDHRHQPRHHHRGGDPGRLERACRRNGLRNRSGEPGRSASRAGGAESACCRRRAGAH